MVFGCFKSENDALFKTKSYNSVILIYSIFHCCIIAIIKFTLLLCDLQYTVIYDGNIVIY